MSEQRSTGMLLVEQIETLLLELAQWRPGSLAETRDVVAALLGGGEPDRLSLAERLSQAAENLGDPVANPVLAELPAPAAEILQTVTAFHTAAVAEGLTAQIGAEVVEAIEEPWAVRPVEEFFAEHRVVPDLEAPGDGERAPGPEPDEDEQLPLAA
ncbi:hypothetical protein [Kitasatospora sp. NPDC004272]